MHFKNFILGAMLLVLAGCGCGEDTLGIPPGSPLFTGETVVFNVSAPVPPCELEGTVEIRQIDVFVVIDDSNSMNNRRMGLVPQNLSNDPRTRTLVAQEVMKNLQDQLMGDIAASYGISVAEAEARFDLAFGVGFLCDYGGEFAGTGRNFPQDAQARPFTLSMPVIREKHPLFDGLFAQAILTDTPGDGRIVRPGPFVDFNDPQSGIEALYQIATGDGFDGAGDPNGDTNASGAPCAIATQTAPGTSGDVPAVTFLDAADEMDPDNRPMFYVRDSNGNTTTITSPAGGDLTCFASGNLGGVGWRNEAARFVIYTSDVATISPFADPIPDSITSTPGTTPTDPNTVGPATGPRQSRILPTTAFDNDVNRFGDPAIDPAIAPANAATVPNAIAALNNLHIEVLCMGYPFIEPNQAKPNGGVDPTDLPPDIPGTYIDAVTFNLGPNTFSDPTLVPFTHMSAVSLLTGSEIEFANVAQQIVPLPAAYLAGGVWPRDPALGINEGPFPNNITNHIREDLVQRIRNWADDGFLNAVGGAATVNPDDLPTMTMPVTLTVTPNGTFNTNFLDTLGTTLPSNIVVQVPVYTTGMAVPASATAQFPDLGYAILNPVDAQQVVTDTLAYQIVADISGIQIVQGASGSPVAQDLFQQLQGKVANWQQQLFGPTLTLTDASLIITLEEIEQGGSEVEPNEVSVQTASVVGCGRLNAVVGDASAQVGAPCNPFNPGP